MTARIKLIICDLSGVFFTNEEPTFIEAFAKKHALPKAFETRYYDLMEQAEVAKTTGIAVWNELSREFGFNADPRAVIPEMMTLKEKHQEMFDLVSALRRICTVVYLTNYNKDYWEEILKRFDVNTAFDWGAVSYEIGARKPAKETFLYILKKAHVQPGEAIFLDDSEKNLEEASALGITTILFKSKEQLIAELQKAGVSVGAK